MISPGNLIANEAMNVIGFSQGSEIVLFTWNDTLTQYLETDLLEPRPGVVMDSAFFQTLSGT